MVEVCYLVNTEQNICLYGNDMSVFGIVVVITLLFKNVFIIIMNNSGLNLSSGVILFVIAMVDERCQ